MLEDIKRYAKREKASVTRLKVVLHANKCSDTRKRLRHTRESLYNT